MMSRRVEILYCIGVCLCWFAFIQSNAFSFSTAVLDTTLAIDSSDAVVNDKLESLFEQTPGLEESSALDLIPTELWNPSPKASKPAIDFRSRFSRKLQPARGFTEQEYSGSSLKSYQRLKLTHGEHLGAGLILEKDAGENSFADFAAGYLMLKDSGPLITIVLGDYCVEAGQGIALWRGFSFSKGAEVVLPAKKKGRGIVPYLSSDENSFLRGAAAAVSISEFQLLLFYSSKVLSATVDSSGRVTSFYTSGYFRTEGEKSKKNALTEHLFGGRVVWDVSVASIVGLSIFTARYSRNIQLTQPRFSDQEASTAFFDYNFQFDPIKLFGEWGYSRNALGGISGFSIVPSSTMGLIAVLRNYPSTYFNLHNGGFGEREGTSNEQGVYLGTELRPHRSITIAAYVDYFAFPSPTSTAIFGGRGREHFFQATTHFIPRLSITARYRIKTTTERTTMIDPSGISFVRADEKSRQSFRISFDYRVSSTSQVRTRIEYDRLRQELRNTDEEGMVVYEEIHTQLSRGLAIDGRVAVFRSDTFESGIATYEPDLPGVITVPILYGRGARWYVRLRYKAADSIRISFKYSELVRDDVTVIGSGLDELPTNRDNRMSLQLDLSF